MNLTPELHLTRPAALFNCCTDNAEPDWTDYAGLELGGCRDDDGATITGATLAKAEFFTIYGRDPNGYAEAITDVGHSIRNALHVLWELNRRTGLPVSCVGLWEGPQPYQRGDPAYTEHEALPLFARAVWSEDRSQPLNPKLAPLWSNHEGNNFPPPRVGSTVYVKGRGVGLVLRYFTESRWLGVVVQLPNQAQPVGAFGPEIVPCSPASLEPVTRESGPHHPMNATRADWAETAVAAFVEAVRTDGRSFDQIHVDDQQDAIGDLIGNLLHFARLNGFDPLKLLERGRAHFTHETQPDYQGD